MPPDAKLAVPLRDAAHRIAMALIGRRLVHHSAYGAASRLARRELQQEEPMPTTKLDNAFFAGTPPPAGPDAARWPKLPPPLTRTCSLCIYLCAESDLGLAARRITAERYPEVEAMPCLACGSRDWVLADVRVHILEEERRRPERREPPAHRAWLGVLMGIAIGLAASTLIQAVR